MLGRPVSSAVAVFGPFVVLAAIVLFSKALTPIFFKSMPKKSGSSTEAVSPSNAATPAGENSHRHHPTKSDRHKPAPFLVHPAQRMLMAITIPVIDCEDAAFEDAIEFLRMRSRELDPDPDPVRRGVSFVVRKPRLEGGAIDQELDAEGALTAPDPGASSITYHARGVPLWTALNDICAQAGMRVFIDEFAITIVPRDSPDPEPATPVPDGDPFSISDDPFSNDEVP